MRFKTKTGSIYTIDRGTMGWCRERAEKSGAIRQEFGTLVEWPFIVVGKSATLFDNNVLPGCLIHAVRTSEVVEILEDEVC